METDPKKPANQPSREGNGLFYEIFCTFTPVNKHLHSPMTIDDIALTFEEGVNCRTAAHLVGVFGSAGAVYAAAADELVARAQLNPRLAAQIARRKAHDRAAREMEFIFKQDIRAVESTSEYYPALLRECSDYPHVLYMKGDPELLRAPMLSIVGTRKPTTYGLSAVNRIVGDLARMMPELVIVSGLAYGIDVAAHRAAMAHGLRTIGVMAGPLDSVYPSVHRAVAGDMVARGGGLLTEMRSGDTPTKPRFLQRNRIIAGIGEGTLVVQSPLAGGSMATAGMADGYSRTVMAVPANIGEEASEGTNALIRRLRARMVCSAGEILEELGWLTGAMRPVQPEEIRQPEGADARKVYDCLGDGPRMSLEAICDRTGIPLPRMAGILMELEFDGYIRALPGNMYDRL